MVPFITKYVSVGAKLYTDEFRSYNKLGKTYTHATINHSLKLYVNGDIHTNSIENFWSVLKRGIYGIYHHVTPKHLQRYCDEFSYRFNSRKLKDADRFTLTLQNLEGRLTYNKLVYGQETKPQKTNSKEEK